jgi:hypothetical protein
MELMEIAEAGNTLKLTPWVTARVPVGADVAASQPTVVGTTQVGTELSLAVNRAALDTTSFTLVRSELDRVWEISA